MATTKKKRCDWGEGPDELLRYHDVEWGRPIVDDRLMFERVCLEGFQAGLSWLTVLRKREAFREAFRDFDVEEIARFGARDKKRLMNDARIIRSAPKIEAAIANANAVRAMGEPLAAFMWSFAPKRPRAPRTNADIPAVTPEPVALAKALKKRGFKFVGPTTVYAMMQATGIVNDHLVRCFVRKEVARHGR